MEIHPKDVEIFHKKIKNLMVMLKEKSHQSKERFIFRAPWVSPKCYGTPSSSCWDLSVWTKVVVWQAHISITRATRLVWQNIAITWAHKHPPIKTHSTCDKLCVWRWMCYIYQVVSKHWLNVHWMVSVHCTGKITGAKVHTHTHTRLYFYNCENP